MAAADVGQGRETRAPPLRHGAVRTWLAVYLSIWALTLTCAVIVAIVGEPLVLTVHHALELRLSPKANRPPDLGRVLALAAHNIPIVSWPLLLGALGAHRTRTGRRGADCLVVAWVTANVAPVGAALGAYGAALLPYVPQLPLEWAALGIAAGTWLEHRNRPIGLAEALRRLAAIVLLLSLAALVETTAAPHR